MSKRFIDTDLIRKSWYRHLTPSQKALWIYLVSACDVAGVVECDLEAMTFAINAKITMKDVQALGNQVELFDGNKLHIIDFVSFQFGQLSPACKPHLPIIKLIEKYNFERVCKGYPKGINTLEDKEKEMDKEEDKEKEGGCKGDSATSKKPRNLLMDALAECDGDPLQIPSSAWGRIAKALAEIKAVCPDVTPEEIKRRAANYKTHFGANISLTSTALVKHWAKCDIQHDLFSKSGLPVPSQEELKAMGPKWGTNRAE